MVLGRLLECPRTAPSPHSLHLVVRFNVWPYLERFALDAETEVLVEMGGKPDLIIGNYRCGLNLSAIMTSVLSSMKLSCPFTS